MKSGRARRATIALLLCVFVGLALAAKHCPQCGTANPDNARFCKNCGYEFPARSRPMPRALPRVRAMVEVEPGVVTINSTPSGATVKVNGTSRGETPLRLTGLSAGRHELELSRSGYRRYYGSFVFVKPRGTLVVKTMPAGATIVFDSRDVGVAGEAGLTLAGLELGSHILVARLAGYEDQVRTIRLALDELVVTVDIAFPVNRGFLRVESDPRGAAVLVNGDQVGTTTYFGTLVPARYQVAVTMAGFNDWSREVRVGLRDTVKVFASLHPVRVRKPGFLWLGIAGIAGGAAGVVLGQMSYTEYEGARPPEYTSDEIAELRRNTELYDWVRNVAGGIGVLSLGAYIVF